MSIIAFPGSNLLSRAARIAAAALVLASLPAPARAAAPLSRLAESLAGEIVAAAHGRAVEIGTAEDRTDSGGTLGLDFQSLLRARLEGRVRLTASGPRLRADCVLAEGPGRLWVSARLIEQPGGRLADILAASAEADPVLLSLVPSGPVGGAGPLAVVSSRRTPLLEGRVLDVALVGEDRALVLYEDAAALYRLGEDELALLSRRDLPGPLAPVRFPGGTILLPPGEDSAWVLTSRSPRAVLFGLEGGRLEERQQAAAMPWPRAAGGLRYRPGTNLVEGVVTDMGEGPFLRLEPHGLALTPEGRLRVGSPDGARTLEVKAGGAVVRLGSDWIAVPGADPPGPKDAVVLLDARDPSRSPVETLPVEGAVRALSGRGVSGRLRLLAAVEEGRGTHLVVIDLAPATP